MEEDPQGRLRALCLALPEVVERGGVVEHTFRVRDKLFGFVAAAWAVQSSADGGGEQGGRLAVDGVRCGSGATRRDGQTRLGGQRWRCRECRRRFTARSTSAFSRHDSPDDISALAVRWYARDRLRYADLAEWLAERGVAVDRSTVYRWVQRFLPLFREAARAPRHPVGDRWRVDETYCRLHGTWASRYRAIDQPGQVVDV